ncbi:MAG: GYF domain-containing protein [Luteolibacter sp.]
MAQWHYGENGQQHGPVDENGIRQAIASGLVQPQTLVWREGMPNWLPLSQVAELGGPSSAYQQSPYVTPYAPTNGLAIASMVCGIVSIFMCWVHILGAIPAVICGHMALARINESPVPMGGRGMAIAGLILGYLCIAATLGGILFFVFSISLHP